MSIRMIGIDHMKASVDIRAIFSFTKKEASTSMLKLKQKEEIDGIVIISTCNRTEIWISSKDDRCCIFNLLEEIKEIDIQQYQNYFVQRSEIDAVKHLFKMTCGLKSQILGEDQIIAQVKDALSLSRENNCTDSILETLFRMAITASKKVKTEICLTRANRSIIHSAIQNLSLNGYDVRDKKCMVIGNGQMGKICADTLVEAGAHVTVTVRQYHSGIVEIPNGCNRINYGDRMNYFKECDLIVSATASPNYTLKKDSVSKIELTKPIVLIDLAVPRDIEPEIGELNYIQLYDIDSFNMDIQDSQIEENILKANEILDSQLDEFISWYQCRDIIPRIEQIKNVAVTDLESRIQKTINSITIEPEKRQYLNSAIEYAATKAVNKMIFGLKSTVSQETFRACVEGLEKVYQTD